MAPNPDKDAYIASLQKELSDTRQVISKLARRVEHGESYDTTYAASV